MKKLLTALLSFFLFTPSLVLGEMVPDDPYSGSYPGGHTFTYNPSGVDQGNWTWTAPSWSATFNAGTGEWLTVDANGEEWSRGTIEGQEYPWTNTQGNNQDTAREQSATHQWFTNDITSARNWLYFSENDCWYDSSITLSWTFNPATRIWTLVDHPTEQWEYAYDTTNTYWFWQEVGGTGEKWKHESTNQWRDVVADPTRVDPTKIWTANNTTFVDSSSVTWSNIGDGYWYDPGQTNSRHLPPIPPPTPAALWEIIRASYDTAAALDHYYTSSYIDNLQTTVSTYADTYNAYLANFLALDDLSGEALLAATQTLTTNLVTLEADIHMTLTSYPISVIPTSQAPTFTANAGTDQYGTWKNEWIFQDIAEYTGRGLVTFKAKGSNLAIGFDPGGTSTTAYYDVIIKNSTNTASLRQQKNTVLSTHQIGNLITDDGSFYDYWFSYDKGAVLVGTGTNVYQNIIFEDTISTPTDIIYFSFGNEPGTTVEYKGIQVHRFMVNVQTLTNLKADIDAMQQHITFSGHQNTYDAHASTLSTVLTTTGSPRKTAAQSLKSNTTTLTTDIATWNAAYLAISDANYDATETFMPPLNDGLYREWKKNTWKFRKPGQSTILFSARGAGPLMIGFDQTPPKTGIPLYDLIVDSSSTIRQNGVNTLATTPTGTVIPNNGTFYDYWVSYNNGTIKFGTGTIVDRNTLVDFTISDTTTPIVYFSFSSQNASTEFKSIRTLPLDAKQYETLALILDEKANDQISIGQFHTDIDNIIADLGQMVSADDGETRLSFANIATTSATSALSSAQALSAITAGEPGGLLQADSVSHLTNIITILTNIKTLCQQSVNAVTAENFMNATLAAIPTDSVDYTTLASSYQTATNSAQTIINSITTGLAAAASLDSVSSITNYLASRKINAEDQKESIGVNSNLATLQQQEIALAYETADEEAIAAQQLTYEAQKTSYVKQKADFLSASTSTIGSVFSDINMVVFDGMVPPDVLETYTTQAANKLVSLSSAEFKTYMTETLKNLEVDVYQGESGAEFAINPENALALESVPVTTDFELTFTTTTSFANQVEILTTDTIAGVEILLSSSGAGGIHLRELILDADTKLNAHVKIFMDTSARLGLGPAYLNKDSDRTPSTLGDDTTVKIAPNGNAIVELNADVTITGTEPIVPTVNFGSDSTAPHKLTFFSPIERVLRITKDLVLDLTGFGKANHDGTQEIVFAGKIIVLMEAGAKIRFPYLTYKQQKHAPVLRFTDEARLIFEGTQNRDECRWTDGTGADAVRNKFMGIGHIILEKDAETRIFDTALVSIEADANSPKTRISWTIKDNAKFLIGDRNKAGGAFQVGNITNVSNTQIDCIFTLDGKNALLYIAREGFLGFGMGTVNKASNPNGTIPSASTDSATINGHATQYDAWRVQSLHNVRNIGLNIQKGYFSHNRIADGSSRESSILGIGPILSKGKYLFNIANNRYARLNGGGNVLFLDNTITHSEPYIVRIWSTASPLDGISDNGKYSLLAPSAVIQKRRKKTATGFSLEKYGRGYVLASDTSYKFAGPQIEFFKVLTMHDYTTKEEKFVAAGTNQFETTIGYVNGTTIKRLSGVTKEQPTNGYFVCAGADDYGDPLFLISPTR